MAQQRRCGGLTLSRRVVAYFLAGTLWGGLAYLLGARAFGPTIWAGVIAAPLIGVLVGTLLQPGYQRVQGLRRWLIALGGLYLGATVFGLIVGAYDLNIRRSSGISAERLLEGVGTTLYGVTLFILLLWPLAYLTHFMIERWEES